MDKYEYRVKTEQLLEYTEQKQYKKAMEIADTIDWRRVKNASMLNTVSEVYEYNGEYQKSRDILFVAYDRAPGSRKIIYRLALLALKLQDADEASDCYEEFVKIAPKDPNQYVLKYKILKAQKASLSEQIAALEEFKKAEYVEKWAYELACLYQEAGMTAKCLEECDDLILWFSEGKYVYQAMELKMKYKPLTPLQQEKYDSRPGAPAKVRAKNVQPAQEKEENTPPVRETTESVHNTSDEAEVTGETTKIVSDETSVLEKDSEEVSEEVPASEVKSESGITRVVTGATLEEALAQGVAIASGLNVETKAMAEKEEELVLDGQMRIEDILQEWEEKQKAHADAIEEQKKIDEERLRKEREAMLKRQEEERLERERKAAEAEAARKAAEEEAARKAAEEEAARKAAAEEAARKAAEEAASASKVKSSVETAATQRLPDDIMELVEQLESRVASSETTRISLVEEDDEEDDLDEEIFGAIEDDYSEEISEDEEFAKLPGAEEDMIEEVPIADLPEEDFAEEFVEEEMTKTDSEEENFAGRSLDEDKTAEAELGETEFDEEDFAETEFDEEDFAEAEFDEGDFAEAEFDEEDFAETEFDEEDFAEAEFDEEDLAETEFDEEDFVEAEFDEEDFEEIEAAEDDFEEDFDEAEFEEEDFDEEDEEELEEAELEDEFEEAEDAFELDDFFEENLAKHAQSDEVLEIEEPTEDEIQKRIKKSKGGVPFDTGFVVTGRYDLSATSEIGLKAGLTEEQKKLFSYFVPVRGMSEQIVEVLDNDRRAQREGTSKTGNLLVIGRKGSGKTVLAVDIVKAIQKQRNLKQGKVAIVTGESLNKKELANIIQKLRGGAIIIEQAGKLNARTVKELSYLMEKKTGEMLFVLEDQRKPLERILTANPDFKRKFTSKLELPVFINDELVTFGQTYAKENGYKLDEMGILALYSRIDVMQREDHAVTVAEVKEIMDEAIAHSQKANVKHLARRVFGKGTDDSDRVILKEEDFRL